MRVAAGDHDIDDGPARVDMAAAVAFLTTEAYQGRWRGGPDTCRQITAAWRVVGAYDRAGGCHSGAGIRPGSLLRTGDDARGIAARAAVA